MYLQRLRLRNFRNFVDEVIEFPASGAVLIGANGQGKTNLLEAIYYLEVFRSFRGARDEQLVNFDADHFRLEGHLRRNGSAARDGPGPAARESGGEEVVVAAAYAREGRRKKVTLGGQEPDRLGDAIGRVAAVIFTSSDVEIIRGSPGGRRRFLDIILSLVEPTYLISLQRYRQILAQRNELLRDGAGPASVSAWDEGLVRDGSRLLEARGRWIADSADRFTRFYSEIAGGGAAVIGYEPSVSRPETASTSGAPTREEWGEAFRLALGRQAERERRRGLTVVGPHRDDMVFRVGDDRSIDLRAFGSAGQQRTAAIALRMVEADTLRAARGQPPLLMLDDVFAELDPPRAHRMIERVTVDAGQVLVTSPKPEEVSLLGGRLAEYRIEQGRVHGV